MSHCIRRTVTTYYEGFEGVDHTLAPEVSIAVELEADNGRTPPRILTDLDAAGVPESEQAGVIARATELYWSAEHRDYLRSPEAERDGA